MDAGLNLVGFPYTVSRMTRSVQAANTVDSVPAVTHDSSSSADIEVQVKNDGYYPYRVVAPAGVPVRLHLITEDTHSCSRAFVIPTLNIQKLLWATGEEVVEIPAQKAGSELAYSCSMGMYNGVIVFE
jgi:plastocyanin domain-containing protein